MVRETSAPEGVPSVGEGMRETTGRRLTWPWFLAVVAGYLVILQGIGLLLKVDTTGADTQFPTTEAVVRGGVIPIGLSVAYGALVTTWLGWWPLVMRCRFPVRRWVWLVPVSMIIAALAGIGYGHLSRQPTSLVVAVAAMTLLVGVGEELMFRGLGVMVFRRAGGVLWLPMLVHGLWDFSLISGIIGDKAELSPGIVLVIALQIVLIIILLVRRRHIDPTPAPEALTPAS